MITHSLNIYPNHIYITWHKHWCLPILFTYQKLILLIQIIVSIDEKCENYNHMHLVHWYCLYMNDIKILNAFIPGSIEFGKYSTGITSIYNCLFSSQCWIYISIPVVLMNFLHYLSLTLYCFWCTITGTIISSIPTFYWTKDTDMSNIKWQFSIVGM